MKGFTGFILVFCLVSESLALPLGGSSEPSTEQYISLSKIKSLLYQPEVAGRARNEINNQYYGGASSSEVVDAYEADADVHLGSTFDACMSLVVISNGCEFADLHLYWWPVTTVEIGNFSETRYATKDLYKKYNPDFEKKSGDGHYGKAQDYAAEGIDRAIEIGGGRDLGFGSFGLSRFDPEVERLDQRYRFLNGGAGGMTIRDYHLTPTLAQMAWASSIPFAPTQFFRNSYAQYSSELAEDAASDLRNSHDEAFDDLCHSRFITKERFSDVVPMAEPARDVGWSLANFSDEMDELEENPLMCTDENIEEEASPEFLKPLVDALGGSSGGLGIGGGLSGGLGGGFGDNACIPGWGRTRPVTIYGHDKMSDLSVAGITTIKAINTATKIEGPFMNYGFSYPIDRVQWVRPEAMGKLCLPAGMAGPGMLGMSNFKKNDNPGTASVTHWKFFACCDDPL